MTASPPPRARDLGIPFEGTPGPWNAITDVPGVAVGHTTLIRGAAGPLVIGTGPVRTGVTAILPRGQAQADAPVAAGFFSLNGCGEMTGMLWVEESGLLNGPIMLTNTRAVGVVHEAVMRWGVAHFAGFEIFGLPVVGETFDGYLNDIRGHHVTLADATAALDSATNGPVAEGNVGGGTGMTMHAFKGGIGTSSRALTLGERTGTLGVLVQANHGTREELRIAGISVGQAIADLLPETPETEDAPSSSIVAIVATDLPLLPHQLKRIAKRAALGLARVGGIAHNWSGDLFCAFSTTALVSSDALTESWQGIANRQLNPVFAATVDATEEAIVNALIAAETMSGSEGRTYHAIPHERVRTILRQHGRLIE